jgi:hypothetical protein
MHTPLFSINYDRPAEIIRSRIWGFWSPEESDRYFNSLMPIMADQRRSAGRAKVLADRRGGIPQSAETLARTVSWYDRAYRPGDMSAVVVDTSLLRLQLRRVYPADRANLFLSYEEAESWLRTR